MLSAQCTDSGSTKVTPALFKTCPTPEIMAKTESYEILEYIKAYPYPNAKAEHHITWLRETVKDYNGTVPDDFDVLLPYQGGQKNGKCNVNVAFDKPAMPVDTHVFSSFKQNRTHQQRQDSYWNGKWNWHETSPRGIKQGSPLDSTAWQIHMHCYSS